MSSVTVVSEELSLLTPQFGLELDSRFGLELDLDLNLILELDLNLIVSITTFFLDTILIKVYQGQYILETFVN